MQILSTPKLSRRTLKTLAWPLSLAVLSVFLSATAAGAIVLKIEKTLFE